MINKFSTDRDFADAANELSSMLGLISADMPQQDLLVALGNVKFKARQLSNAMDLACNFRKEERREILDRERVNLQRMRRG